MPYDVQIIGGTEVQQEWGHASTIGRPNFAYGMISSPALLHNKLHPQLSPSNLNRNNVLRKRYHPRPFPLTTPINPLMHSPTHNHRISNSQLSRLPSIQNKFNLTLQNNSPIHRNSPVHRTLRSRRQTQDRSRRAAWRADCAVRETGGANVAVLVDVCFGVEVCWEGGGGVDDAHSAEGEGEFVLFFRDIGGEDGLAGGVVGGYELGHGGWDWVWWWWWNFFEGSVGF
jgi:hypothetical protein